MQLDYYTLYKMSKDLTLLRKAMVAHALEHGIQSAADAFKTTPKTVRKWVHRWQTEPKQDALTDRSKAPKRSPNQMILYWQFKIADVYETAQKDNKRINASMIKRTYTIPYSIKTTLKYLKENGYKTKKTQHQKKRDMREVKEKYRAFEKMQVDIKYLDDIPEMYMDFKRFGLPRYQITARCLRTGALFFGYTHEKSTTSTALFITRFLHHLQAFGVVLRKCHFQTDNGTEFASAWNSLKTTLFTKIIEEGFLSTHKTIPVGAKTYQSDVESSHRLIEDEFYACEYFSSLNDFLDKAHRYQNHFNFERHNSYKKGSPVNLLKALEKEIDEQVLDFKPVIVDNYLRQTKDFFRQFAS